MRGREAGLGQRIRVWSESKSPQILEEGWEEGGVRRSRDEGSGAAGFSG